MTNKMISLESVEEKIITLRNQQVLLDSDVAELYGVETKRINEAVKNNPDKFPEGYLIYANTEETNSLRTKNSSLKNLGRGEHFKYNPVAFTEKGLYMLATILKSKQATETTLLIVETFAQFRELSRTVQQIATTADEQKQKKLMQKSGEMISDLLGDSFATSDTETTIELNFAVLKLKHTIKRKAEK